MFKFFSVLNSEKIRHYSDFDMNLINFTDYLRNYNLKVFLVIGFSTGHVGTTSLSAPEHYANVTNCIFIFEEGDVGIRYNKKENWTVDDEEFFVQKKYGMHILGKINNTIGSDILKNSSLAKNITIIDLSHKSLWIYRGLERISNRFGTDIKLHFIRIRRDRFETAFSIANGNSFFKADFYRYHPHEKMDLVILNVSTDIWLKLTETQKAFWVIDETESRWIAFEQSTSIAHTDILWGKQWLGSNSFEAAIGVVSRIINAVPNAMISDQKPHTAKLCYRPFNLLFYQRKYLRVMNYGAEQMRRYSINGPQWRPSDKASRSSRSNTSKAACRMVAGQGKASSAKEATRLFQLGTRLRERLAKRRKEAARRSREEKVLPN